MSRDLRSMTAVIKALGEGDPRAGRRELIRITQRSTQHVTNWLAEGRFPAWTWLVISTALARTGHHMHPSVCGLAPPPGVRKNNARKGAVARQSAVS